MTENDLISRQAAIDAICKVCANGDDYTACRDRDIKSRWCDNITALRDLPSAQPEQRWIPCGERLPEVEELVLVTDDSGGIKTVDVDRCGQYENSNERFWYYMQNAVAWMPLPEPYAERRKS